MYQLLPHLLLLPLCLSDHREIRQTIITLVLIKKLLVTSVVAAHSIFLLSLVAFLGTIVNAHEYYLSKNTNSEDTQGVNHGCSMNERMKLIEGFFHWSEHLSNTYGI